MLSAREEGVRRLAGWLDRAGSLGTGLTWLVHTGLQPGLEWTRAFPRGFLVLDQVWLLLLLLFLLLALAADPVPTPDSCFSTCSHSWFLQLPMCLLLTPASDPFILLVHFLHLLLNLAPPSYLVRVPGFCFYTYSYLFLLLLSRFLLLAPVFLLIFLLLAPAFDPLPTSGSSFFMFLILTSASDTCSYFWLLLLKLFLLLTPASAPDLTPGSCLCTGSYFWLLLLAPAAETYSYC